MSMENLNLFREMAYACTRCGYCRQKYSDDAHTKNPAYRVCPVWEHGGGFEHQCSRGKLQIAQGILEGLLDYSEQLINLLYTDPDCKLCSWVCAAEPVIEPQKVWQAMRRDIVAAGLGPPEPLKKIDSHVKQRHNVFGGRAELRGRWAEGLDISEEGEVLYFAGCYASYSQTEIARSTVAILRAAGIEPAYLGSNEWCCGVVQLHNGSISIAEEMVRHNINAIRNSGAKTVITACAECLKSFKSDYPEIVGQLNFDIVHISEVLAGLLKEGKIALDKPLRQSKVTYHDPCRLGRYCGIYDEPRQLIEAIPDVKLVEMLRHREYAWCCGNGAELVSSVDSQLMDRIASDRIEEARETGAEMIVTSCPRCISSLDKAGDGIEICDLTVAIADAMGLRA